MKRRPFKIGVAGTHSTGKSTFLRRVEDLLTARGVVVSRIDDLAARAQKLGFPILSQHTFESTLWIMSECIRQEMEASLRAQVILVDRPVPDALGYLLAALEVSGREIEKNRLIELRKIVEVHIDLYDYLILTELDASIPLGDGRDDDEVFRIAAARHVTGVMNELAPQAVIMNSQNTAVVADEVVAIAVRLTE